MFLGLTRPFTSSSNQKQISKALPSGELAALLASPHPHSLWSVGDSLWVQAYPLQTLTLARVVFVAPKSNLIISEL